MAPAGRMNPPPTFKMTITESQELLLKAVKANRLAPVYLIVGAEKEERRALAKFLTQALFCSEITPGSLPCNHCSVCRRVAEEKHPDVFRAKVATHSGKVVAYSGERSHPIQSQLVLTSVIKKNTKKPYPILKNLRMR